MIPLVVVLSLFFTVHAHQPFFVSDPLRPAISIPSPISQSRVWYVEGAPCVPTPDANARPLILLFNASIGDEVDFSVGQPRDAIAANFSASLKNGEEWSTDFHSQTQTPSSYYEPYTRTDNTIRLTTSKLVGPSTGVYSLIITPSNQSAPFWFSFGTDEGGEDFTSLNIIEFVAVTLPKIADFYKKSAACSESSNVKTEIKG